MHAQILTLHLWILALLWMTSDGFVMSDWALGFNVAMLIVQMIINFVFWKMK